MRAVTAPAGAAAPAASRRTGDARAAGAAAPPPPRRRAPGPGARGRWLEVLAEITRAITVAPSLERATDDMVDMLVQAFDFERIAYFEPIAAEPGWLRCVRRGGNQEGVEPGVDRWPMREGLIARVARTGVTIAANRVEAVPGYLPLFAATRSELVVPLVDGGAVIGVIDIQSQIPDFFPSTAVDVVEAIAAQAVVVRRVAALRRQQELRLLEQQTIHRLSLDLLAARPYRETLQYVTRQLTELCRADSSGLYLVDRERGDLVLSVCDGIQEKFIGARLALGEGLSGSVALSRRTEHVGDYAAWASRASTYEGEPWRATLATPLLHGDDLLGVIAVMSLQPQRAFGEDDIRIIERLAVPAALAIHNAREVEDHAADLAHMADLARSLSLETDGEDARGRICTSALGLVGADVAALVERVGETVRLTATAPHPHAGAVLDPAAEGAVTRCLGDATPAFVSRPGPTDVPEGLELTEGGRPRSLHCQPIVREGRCVAVLVTGYAVALPGVGERRQRLLAVLASDAAVALERADLYARLDALARRDGLTGAANRRAWDDQLPARLARAGAAGREVSVAMLDLDHFKSYNDSQGHQRGDLILRECGSAWQEQLRDGDLLARYGGEEFAVVLEDSGLEMALAAVERLRAATPAGQTCSAGVATWNGLETADELVARVDAALYEAKVRGRDRAVVAPSLDLRDDGVRSAGDRTGQARGAWTRWTRVLPRLLADRTIQSVYQPVVRLAAVPCQAGRLEADAIVGYEALARPTDGPIDMGVEGLFAAAQYRGMARDLDWLCRRVALEGAGGLPAGSLLFVNVSVSALIDPVHGVDQMELLLDWVGRRPDEVVLEVTEREAVSDRERFVEVLALYRERGFRIALDDVGEGHSTLEVLAAARPEFIKLARSLVHGITERGPRAALRAVVAFADDTGAQVIAEGIETPHQAGLMLAVGVTLGQGYGLAPPSLSPPGFGPDPRVAGRGGS